MGFYGDGGDGGGFYGDGGDGGYGDGGDGGYGDGGYGDGGYGDGGFYGLSYGTGYGGTGYGYSGTGNDGGIGGDGTKTSNILHNPNDSLKAGDDTSGNATDATSEGHKGAYDTDRGTDKNGNSLVHGGIDVQPLDASGNVMTNAHALSIAGGTVTYVGPASGFGDNTVVIHMADGNYLTYGHMSSASVSVGQTVSVGDTLGVVGSEGNSSGIHVHIQESEGGPFFNSPGFVGFVDPGTH